jgi:gamma-glutamyltranspeptidase/glutathione hydrolase
VAVTTTINSLYGNLVTVPGAGFLPQQRDGRLHRQARRSQPVRAGAGAANAVAPGKRMLSAMTPTIVLDPAGRVKLVTGTPGGSTIITSVAQTVSNVVDFGMDVAAATSAPRLHHQHLPDTLRFERRGLDSVTVARLRAMGHAVAERSGFQGDVQSIVVSNGVMTGVADPRRGGAAVGIARLRAVVQ